MTTPPPLILLPGMGADERVFAPQRAAFPNLIVPRWITPTRREPLTDYARRMAAAVDPGRPCFVGGLSLGGMVAGEMARHLPTIGCFLIASVCGPHELPWRVRAAGPLATGFMFRVVVTLAGGVLRCAGGLVPPIRRGLMRQLSDADARFLHWAAGAVLSWRPSAAPAGVPVLHIHGDRDPILPIRLTRPDVIVRGGGHVLTVTHPAEVNRFLQTGLDRLGARVCAGTTPGTR